MNEGGMEDGVGGRTVLSLSVGYLETLKFLLLSDNVVCKEDYPPPTQLYQRERERARGEASLLLLMRPESYKAELVGSRYMGTEI